MQTKHAGVIYPCKKCNFKAKQKGQLNLLKLSIHEAVIYQCNKCNYNSKQKESLKEHVDVHHEGVQLKCKHYEFITKWRSILTINVISVTIKEGRKSTLRII